ncbi:MAG TPA: RodZ domain-containing protein [Bryobacteraceae bacterium]|nr:RodZ domain-containing protein [Bryobacteraceae bacterium]
MQCLYCDRRLGLFSTAKGAFCSDEHEELYRSAAQKRLETPYESAAGDLAHLLKATQADQGATVEAKTEAAIPAAAAEAAMVTIRNSIASGNVPASSQAGHAYIGTTAPSVTTSSDQSQQESGAPSQSDPQWALIPDAPPAKPQVPTERRAEPRIKDIKILKVATLRDPEKQVNCALVDISDAGIQFTSDIDFRVGEVLIAELPDQIALAEVRYSQSKDGRYVVGLERAQTISQDAAASAATGADRAGLLIETLCDRVKAGFVQEGQTADRTKALERVARILEVWQNIQSPAAPPVLQEKIEIKPSTGLGRAFGAVGAVLLIGGMLTVYVLQFQKNQTPLPPPPRVPSAPALSKVESTITTPVPAMHRAQIRAIQPAWIGISVDGKNVFGGMLAKGVTRDVEYSKFAFLHAGNAAGVEIIVDGKPVSMAPRPGLRLIELNATGYKFLRWSNDDPPQP